jgi:hypothetical protein
VSRCLRTLRIKVGAKTEPIALSRKNHARKIFSRACPD